MARSSGRAIQCPNIEMAIIFDAGVLAQSDPGGHQKNIRAEDGK
jgi:hypothetical protein